MIASGACMAVTMMVIFIKMALHATHMSNPSEQLKIMKIATLFPNYSVLSYFSIVWPNAYNYLNPWTEFLAAVAMFYFFMLLCDFLAPNDRERIEFLSSLQVRRQFQKKKTRNGVQFVKVYWYLVLQCPFVLGAVAVATCIIYALGQRCVLSTKFVSTSSIALEVVKSVSMAFAMSALIFFQKMLRPHVKEHGPLRKFLAFKGAILLSFVESILFLILHTSKVLHKTDTLSYSDAQTGIPCMISCIQMLPFAFLFAYAYPIRPYRLPAQDGKYVTVSSGNGVVKATHSHYQGGPWGWSAWMLFLNPLEFSRDIISMWKLVRQVPDPQANGGEGVSETARMLGNV
ncbi:uncharacterized protein N7459_008144 [Penicillium hispanicum]|uniref:uncharacterized protein n=1 Tax=Penicillium hispanicum TaxID=1080232 RepID=UPI002540411A|nr:uncharacterized protein N7459_008144 [Penicillium hispanicum]KAJ5573717.1 hypothetical protein N7459_008144 [Penicillium hispanicum]